ncbi:hypothetical protein RhiirC2_763302, partial [Rhizophagus irregularis]
MGKISLTGYDYPAKVFLDGSNPNKLNLRGNCETRGNNLRFSFITMFISVGCC